MKMWFRALFATFGPCPWRFKTHILGTAVGHLSGVPREVNKKPFRNTPLEAHMLILVASQVILESQRGVHLRAKSAKLTSWNAKVDPRWLLENSRPQK